jgi:hypothetical protein
MNEAAPRIDWKLKTNAPNPFAYTWRDENGQVIDYGDSTFKLQVKERDGAGNPTGSVLLTLQTGLGIGGDHSLGEFQPVFPSEDNSGLPAGQYIFDCIRLVSGIPVETVLVGNIDVEEGITS